MQGFCLFLNHLLKKGEEKEEHLPIGEENQARSL
jgi:hypothetical protein